MWKGSHLLGETTHERPFCEWWYIVAWCIWKGFLQNSGKLCSLGSGIAMGITGAGIVHIDTTLYNTLPFYAQKPNGQRRWTFTAVASIFVTDTAARAWINLFILYNGYHVNILLTLSIWFNNACMCDLLMVTRNAFESGTIKMTNVYIRMWQHYQQLFFMGLKSGMHALIALMYVIFIEVLHKVFLAEVYLTNCPCVQYTRLTHIPLVYLRQITAVIRAK